MTQQRDLHYMDLHDYLSNGEREYIYQLIRDIFQREAVQYGTLGFSLTAYYDEGEIADA